MNFKIEEEVQISVIIPVYNDLPGLNKTVNSILRQSFKHFEIIVINDGGDPSIEKFCSMNSIRFINIVPNKGSYNARNEGVKVARTQYIAFTDADLEVDKDWLKKGCEDLISYDYVAGNVTVDEKQIVDVATFHDYLTAFPIQKYFDNSHFGVTANLFVNKKLFDKVGMFDAELRSGGDMEFGNRVYINGGSQYFAKDAVVIHPLRGHDEKLKKSRRIREGFSQLVEKYPERLGFLKRKIRRNSFKQLLIDVLPPKIGSVRRIYKDGYAYSFWDLYKYIYFLKLRQSFVFFKRRK